MADEGVKVYTIGVGTETGGPIPLKINGSLIGYKKDRKGRLLSHKRKPDVLQEIAQSSEGSYIVGNKTDKPVNTIEDAIGECSKSEFETKQFSDYEDQFQWFWELEFYFYLDIFLLDKKTKWLEK